MLNWGALSDTAKSSLVKVLNQAKKSAPPLQRCYIESMLYADSGDTTHLKKLAVFLPKIDTDLELGLSNFFSLTSLHFNARPEQGEQLAKYVGHNTLEPMFRTNLALAQSIYDETIGSEEAQFERNGVVVLLAKQFLLPPHAPSVRVLNFAKALIENHGKSPIILVTGEFPGSYDGCIIPCAKANNAEEFMSADAVTWEEVKIPFAFLSTGSANTDSFARGISAINSLNPEMVISISAPSLFAEIFAESRFSFLYQTVADLPYVDKCYFHTWAEADEETQEKIKKRGLEKQYLFAQHPGFDQKQAFSEMKRTDHGIAEDAFVFAIVGMRLSTDVDDTFLAMLADIAQKSARAHFLFAGPFGDYAAKFAKHPGLEGRTSAIGQQGDMMAVYGICDAFLNPIRKGGGGGIVYAMQAGLPSLSTAFGDAGRAVANFDTIEDYAHMAEVAQRLMDDCDFYADYKSKTLEEVKYMSDGSKIVARIVEEFEKYAEARS